MFLEPNMAIFRLEDRAVLHNLLDAQHIYFTLEKSYSTPTNKNVTKAYS